MQNQRAAVARRLSDPDFQAVLVNRCIGLVMIMSVLLLGFMAHDAWIWSHPPTPRYFYIDGQHPPRPAAPLDSPVVDDNQLLDWAVRAILAAYNVNYHDYPIQLSTASRRFTENGWTTFAGSFIKSGNLDEVKKAMLLCYAEAQRAAIIHRSMIVRGALAYEVQVPIVQTCQNTQQQSTQNLLMTAQVMRTNDDDHPDGLVIDQLVAVAH